MTKKARVIAHYLPQFYPIPENDEWWEEGFTEWTNVKKATPLFEGHSQPVIPGELGYYDLRDIDTREKQASLAKEYGIEGFCYWHYWFGDGRRILERVFDEVLHSEKPDFPFCLAWANETWTGIWHGAENRILIEQKYPGKEDYVAHFNYLIDAFKDKRYITVYDKPLFMVYHPHKIPDIKLFTNTFREESIKRGLNGIYLVANNIPDNWDCEKSGFDAIAPARLHTLLPKKNKLLNLVTAGFRKLFSISLNNVINSGPYIFDYQALIDKTLLTDNKFYKYFPNVISNWDNTPRSGRRGWILKNATPESFSILLRKAVEYVQKYDDQEKIVFIKSWNEWAEGNYIEPDQKYGRGFLESCKQEIQTEN